MSFQDWRKLSRQCNAALLPRFFWLCWRCHTRFGLMSPRLLFEPLMKMAGCWSTWWACEDEGRWVDKSRRRRGGSEGGKGTQSIIHLFDHFSPGHRERLATVERTTERCRDCLLLYIPETLYFQSTHTHNVPQIPKYTLRTKARLCESSELIVAQIYFPFKALVSHLVWCQTIW